MNLVDIMQDKTKHNVTSVLYNGDCLKVMDELIEQGVKVDTIITDPPYGTTACKWDSVIDFDELWTRFNKLLKSKNSPVVLFGAMPFTSTIVNSNIKGYKHHWIWKKNRGTGFQVAKYRPMMATEDIIAFTLKGDRINYNPQKIKLDKPIKYSKASKGNGTNPLANFNKGYYMVNSKFPTNILEYSNVNKGTHPTQKPVALMEYLIKTYTNENEIVLDFTAGSFSTGVACLNTKRNFIGIELDKDYFEIGKKRIVDTINTLDYTPVLSYNQV